MALSRAIVLEYLTDRHSRSEVDSGRATGKDLWLEGGDGGKR